MNGRWFTALEIEAVWGGYAAGDTASVIAQRLGRPCQNVAERIRNAEAYGRSSQELLNAR